MNLVKAARKAMNYGINTVSITGYSGGALKNIVDLSIHINVEDMEMAEDSQLILFHYIKQILINKLSNEENILDDIQDWNIDIRLTKEFETLGFYISDHPLNQYKSIFDQYNIVSYDNFQNDENLLSCNIACTVLKTQEKKTQKGTSYAIIKFSDLNSVFELFVFSDIFEINREVLTEGNSLMLTLMKNYIDEKKTQKMKQRIKQ